MPADWLGGSGSNYAFDFHRRFLWKFEILATNRLFERTAVNVKSEHQSHIRVLVFQRALFEKPFQAINIIDLSLGDEFMNLI